MLPKVVVVCFLFKTPSAERNNSTEADTSCVDLEEIEIDVLEVVKAVFGACGTKRIKVHRKHSTDTEVWTEWIGRSASGAQQAWNRKGYSAKKRMEQHFQRKGAIISAEATSS